jgi:ABC-type nitrate/sulfonate/bicarbonate transport system substrate-binding protein
VNAEKDLTLVDLNPVAAQVAAMDQGQIDAMVTTAAFAFTLVSAKKSELVIDLVSQGQPEHKGAMLTMTGIRKATLAQAPDLADRYSRALGRAVAYIKDPANTNEIMALAGKYGVKVDATIMPELIKLAQRDIGTTIPRNDAELAMKWAVDSGQIKKPMPVNALVLKGLVN